MTLEQAIVVYWLHFAIAGAVILMLTRFGLRWIVEPAERAQGICIALAAVLLTPLLLAFMPFAYFEAPIVPRDAAAGIVQRAEAPVAAAFKTSSETPATLDKKSATAVDSRVANPESSRSEPAPAIKTAQAPTANRAHWSVWTFLAIAIGAAHAAAAAWFLLVRGLSARRLRAIQRGAVEAADNVQAVWPDVSKGRGRAKVLVSDEVAAPMVFGWRRPVIVLPRHVAEGNAADLEYCLAHEWAHIERADMLSWRFVSGCRYLLWLQPSYWKLCREFRICLEFLADHRSSREGAESVEYSELLLELANRKAGRVEGALTMFDESSQLGRRVRMLLEEGRRLRFVSRRSFTCAAVVGAAVLAIGVGAVRIDAAGEPAKPEAVKVSAKAEPGKDDDTEKWRTFDLLVIGPDRKPVAASNIEVRSRPAPTAEQVVRGEFKKGSTYGSYVKTDAVGRLTLRIPKDMKQFDMNIQESGFGPYWLRWSSEVSPQTIPDSFTVELEAGWTVGGKIVDEEGKPVAGVKVHPSIEFKKRPGDLNQLAIGNRITTDKDGRWQFESVPISMTDVHVEISHPVYMPLRSKLAREQFGVWKGAEPTETITLSKGLRVKGTITDDTGKPIAGALVRTKFKNDLREAKTNDEGEYELIGCEPTMARIVVSAKGRATDMKDVRVSPEMDAVDFSLPPGGKVRVRVIDENGKPVARARIFYQRWRGDMYQYFEFDHHNQYADENGVWEWNEAPVDEFQVDIVRPGGMQLTYQKLIAREEEYVFRPPPALVVSGSVVDATTGAPISAFRVTPGARWKDSQVHWSRTEAATGRDGKFSLRQTREEIAHVVQIEADGYLPVESRDIKSDEGGVVLKFELQPARNLPISVLTPEDQTAAGAQVAIGGGGSQIPIKNGELNETSFYATRIDADAFGRFVLPPQNAAFQMVVLHPTGYAHLKSVNNAVPETIRLTPWARVEGTFSIGGQPVSDVMLEVNSNEIHSYGNGVPSIYTQQEAKTGAGGAFVFDRVFAGKGYIGRRVVVMVSEGATEAVSSMRVPVNLVAGKTERIDLGRSGRRVIGKLAAPADFKEKPIWSFATILVQLNTPEYPTMPAEVASDAEKRKAWWEQWKATEEGRALTAAEQARDASPTFFAHPREDGVFQIDDMPTGEYALNVWHDAKIGGSLSKHVFTVPPADGKQADQPIDLGTLMLKGTAARK